MKTHPRCKFCRERFVPKVFLQKICMLKDECIKSCVLLSKEKTEKEKKKEWNVKKKAIKEKLKTLGDYESEARKEFQKWIRIRDKDQPCISCGTTVTEQWDAGHYLKAELYSGLIFMEINCHKQCNRFFYEF